MFGYRYRHRRVTICSQISSGIGTADNVITQYRYLYHDINPSIVRKPVDMSRI